ncbi:MAG: iron-sulfur cluster carrier protein ApbC [Chitinophagaceae bacterium]|nr:MAG: iron-sulfur cluster carrier protein ApbC [Chitinophagaceae bacterium]
MNITKDQVLEALSTVHDPDLKKDLVYLNMIEKIQIEGNKLSFTVVLTTPACPLKEQIEADCRKAISTLISPDLDVSIEMTARVTTPRKDLNLLPGVRNIVCVASGKGGVGKSTVAVNLALALARKGAKVGIIDADIHGPSIPIMFGLKGERPAIQKIENKHYILPIEKWGVKILSIGFLIDERQSVVWRGPMVSSALRQFVTDVIWGELDYLLLDLPPGTGDVHLTIAQTLPITGAVIVTTPQDVALADAQKGISMFRMESINIPVIGVVENMSYFTPKELPQNRYYIFGKGGGRRIAEEFDTNFLGEIPLVQSIREGGDFGAPVVLEKENPTAEAFMNLGENVARYISILNAEKKEVKQV